MQGMRAAVFENRLRRIERFGNTVRIRLTPETFEKVAHLKVSTQRTYHDIVRAVLAVHRRKSLFDGPVTGSIVLHVRLPRHQAFKLTDEAWSSGYRRIDYLGAIIEAFLVRHDLEGVASVLRSQRDRFERIRRKL